MSQNVFCLQTAPDASYARPIEELAKFDLNDLVREIKAKIFDRSQFGLRSLTKIFKAMDKKGDGCLDVDDFRWGLLDFGIEITKDESMELLKHFDSDKNGLVNFSEFMNALKVS